MDFARLLDRVFARTRQVCAAPFELRRWLVLAATSWLAWLGSVSTNLQAPLQGASFLKELLPDDVELSLLLTLLSMGLLVGLALWLALTWLRSMGQVLFLQIVAQGEGELGALWRSAGAVGSDLFRARVLLDLIAVVVLALVVGAGLGISLALRPDHPMAALDGLPLQLSGAGTALVLLAWRALVFLLDELLLPIAWSQGLSLRQAALPLHALWQHQKSDLLVYLCLRLVAGLSTAMLALGLGCVTCGLLWLPFVLALLFVPVRVLLQALPLTWLHEADPEAYSAFAPLQER